MLPFGRRLLWYVPLVLRLAIANDSTRKLRLRQEIKARLDLDSFGRTTSTALDPGVMAIEEVAHEQCMIAPVDTTLTIILRSIIR